MILNEYRKRLGVLAGFSIVLLMIAGIIFLVPSYMVAEEKFNKVDIRKNELTARLSALSGDKTGDIVKGITEKTSALSPLGAEQNASKVFDALTSRISSGIVVSHFGYLVNSDKTVTADIGGTASGRDTLIAFTNILSSSNVFTGAKLPLSTLTSDKNIDFVFKLGVKNFASTTATSIQHAASSSPQK